VNIARALVLEPRLMILDETCRRSTLWTVAPLALFEAMQSSSGLIYLFISTISPWSVARCTRIGVMYLGKMVEVADTHGTSTIPDIPIPGATVRGCRRWDANPYKPEKCLLDGEPPSPIDIPPGCSFASGAPCLCALPGRDAFCCLT